MKKAWHKVLRDKHESFKWSLGIKRRSKNNMVRVPEYMVKRDRLRIC